MFLISSNGDRSWSCPVGLKDLYAPNVTQLQTNNSELRGLSRKRGKLVQNEGNVLEIGVLHPTKTLWNRRKNELIHSPFTYPAGGDVRVLESVVFEKTSVSVSPSMLGDGGHNGVPSKDGSTVLAFIRSLG